jgi:beta-lactamase superfamily II metal-dependent hydrolase
MSNGNLIPAPPAGQVFVRMYRQGLGDCFLLTFRGDHARPIHMLIDCGTWDTDKESLKKMSDVVDDILESTGRHIHVLVATHEHWDHVSGYWLHKDRFQQATIDQVWLAWTENPKDKRAQALRSTYVKTTKKVGLAIDRLGADDPAFAGAIREVLGAAGGLAKPDKAMEWVRTLPKHNQNKHTEVRFFKPGDVVDVLGGTGARALVLGPPREEDVLRDVDASEARKKRGEVYSLGAAVSHLGNAAFFVAAEHGLRKSARLSEDDRESAEMARPFDDGHKVAYAAAARREFFQKYYGPPPKKKHGKGTVPRKGRRRGGGAGNGRGPEAWRRIDDDWLQMAAQIALWMSDFTNNTSLAMAIELPSQKVLLFVADAQIGSWLSWADLKFEIKGNPSRTVTWDQILANTVLYKVGHHGSHNASLKKGGVEQMIHDDLIAMIPVDRKSLSSGQKKKWQMPRDSLLLDLRRACKDRIIRADDGVLDKIVLRDGTLAGTIDTASANWQRFKALTSTTPTHIQYTVK